MPTLVYNPGELGEVEFAIEGAAVTIGRAESQTICIPHKSLSRSHARIEPDGGSYFIVDLDSKNGTFVNGARVHRSEIRHGDTISLGDLDLLFRVEVTFTHALREATLGPQPQAVRPVLRTPMTKLVGEPGARDPASRSQSRLKILIEVAKLLQLSDDLDSLLRTILDLVFQILDVERGALLLFDPATGTLEPRVVKTARPTDDGAPIYSQNIVEYVLERSVGVLFADAMSDPRLDPARSAAAQSVRASMCVPLRPRGDVIGVLYVDNLSSAHLYSEDDLEFLVAFTSQAAVAIENAALYRRLEQETVARMQLIMEAKLASLGLMVSGIAHELRNPLNFMMNFADISTGLAAELEEGLRAHGGALPPSARAELEETAACLVENTGRISEHGQRADAVIQGMLKHAHRPPGAREPADLNAVVADAARLALEVPQASDVGVRVITEYDPAIGAVEMSAQEIGRVFLNVVENALHAMREKRRARGAGYAPELRIRTAARGGEVEVRIRDNGTGIPRDALARLFEPFFTTKPPGQGTGLGLSLSREIVVQGHRGTMRVESDPGEGTEVIVTLPTDAARSSRI